MKSAKFAERSGNFPDTSSPVEKIRRIRAIERCGSAKVRIVKSNKRRRDEVACPLNVDIARIDMMNAENTSGIVKRVASPIEVLPAQKRSSAGGNGFGNEGETQNFRGIGVESGIGDGAAAIHDFRHRRQAAEQMRLRRRSPLRHSPEGIH